MTSNYKITDNNYLGSDLDDILLPRSLVNRSTIRYKWGAGFNGYSGDAISTNYSSPVTVAILQSDWVSISGTSFHNVGIRTDGNIWGWGINTSGALGDGTTVGKSSPVTMLAPAGITAWRMVSGIGAGSHMIDNTGLLWGVGDNDNGKLGDNSAVTKSSPVTVSGGGFDWRFITGRINTAGGIKADGSAWCWGRSFTGDGTGSNRSSPVSVIGGLSWKFLASSGSHWMGIDSNNTLYSWGRNNSGQLGDGTTVNKSSPITVVGGGAWKNVATAMLGDVESAWVLAIKTDGTLWTWGLNNVGQLGDGTTVNRSSPGTIAGGGTNWKLLAAGNTYQSVNLNRLVSVATKTDGTLWTWGGGEWGVAGDGTTSNRSSPVSALVGPRNWTHITAGESWCHAIAIDDFL